MRLAFASDDATSNIVALRIRQGHGQLARVHGSCGARTCQGSAGDALVRQFAGPTWDPWLLFICSARLMDPVFLHPCSRRASYISLTLGRFAAVKCRWWSVCVCCFFFQVAVLCDVYGLFLLPAAGSHLLCHRCKVLVGWKTIYFPRYCSFTEQRLLGNVPVCCSVALSFIHSWFTCDWFSESRMVTSVFKAFYFHGHRKLEPRQELQKNPGAASHLPAGLIDICLPINLQFMMLTITLI